MKILCVIFSCGRDAGKLKLARAAVERLGLPVKVYSDPGDPVPGIDPDGPEVFSNGQTLWGPGAAGVVVDLMLRASEGYDAVLKVDSDTMVLKPFWKDRKDWRGVYGLMGSWLEGGRRGVYGACYLVTRAALEAIQAMPRVRMDGPEDDFISMAAHDAGVPLDFARYRFPRPVMAHWYFGAPDDDRYDGATAIIFGNRKDATSPDPEAEIEDAMRQFWLGFA